MLCQISPRTRKRTRREIERRQSRLCFGSMRSGFRPCSVPHPPNLTRITGLGLPADSSIPWIAGFFALNVAFMLWGSPTALEQWEIGRYSFCMLLYPLVDKSRTWQKSSRPPPSFIKIGNQTGESPFWVSVCIWSHEEELAPGCSEFNKGKNCFSKQDRPLAENCVFLRAFYYFSLLFLVLKNNFLKCWGGNFLYCKQTFYIWGIMLSNNYSNWWEDTAHWQTGITPTTHHHQ